MRCWPRSFLFQNCSPNTGCSSVCVLIYLTGGVLVSVAGGFVVGVVVGMSVGVLVGLTVGVLVTFGRGVFVAFVVGLSVGVLTSSCAAAASMKAPSPSDKSSVVISTTASK